MKLSLVRQAFAVLALLVPVVVFGQAFLQPSAASPAESTTTVDAPLPPPADPLAEAIRERIDHLRYAAAQDNRGQDVRGQRVILTEAVARYYESQQFRPRWRDPARLDLLIAAIADVYDDGLDPMDYHVEALQSFRSGLRSPPGLAPAEQAELELAATDAMMLALYHLYRGKVDPVELSSQWNFPSRPVSEERGLEQFAQAVDSGLIRETFDRARPQHVWYQRGRERLKEYRAIATAGGWSPISDGPSLTLGMSDPRVPALRLRLETTADLIDDAPATYPVPLVYDEETEAAVKRFQERHGLAADGAVGPATRAALNVPVSARIDQIRVNLERARWVMHEIHGEFVLVDAAGFDVSYFRNDEPIWTSKVIVGRPYRETPIFKSSITHVVLNPTWTIPPTILVKDKLPIIKRDPGYLVRNNIRVIDSSGNEVNPYAVNWGRYGAGNLPPYQLRQDPGEDNALGLVKIMFPNPHMVYLHDTPSKSLFDQDQRTFSSGCIRVERAFELAELVLNDPQKWNQATMAEVVASKRMRTVYLAKPVPVLILYWTSQPRPDGQVFFRNDIYGRDPPTLAALNSSFRLP